MFRFAKNTIQVGWIAFRSKQHQESQQVRDMVSRISNPRISNPQINDLFHETLLFSFKTR